MMMHNPPHVGEILRELYLEPMDISVTDAAKHLGVTRQALSRLVNEQSGISAAMAIRLAKAFSTTPDYWMNMQAQYALWEACQSVDNINVKPFDTAA